MNDASDLTWVQTGYQVNLTRFTPGAAPGVKVLKADARRWYLCITIPSAALTQCLIWPGGVPSAAPLGSYLNQAFGAELTFPTAPGLVGGEWWMTGPGTTTILVCEILKAG